TLSLVAPAPRLAGTPAARDKLAPARQGPRPPAAVPAVRRRSVRKRLFGRGRGRPGRLGFIYRDRGHRRFGQLHLDRRSVRLGDEQVDAAGVLDTGLVGGFGFLASARSEGERGER